MEPYYAREDPPAVPIALFVDSTQFDGEPYVGEYGQPVKHAVLDGILTLDSQRACQFRTWWGRLMLPSFRPASASSDGAFALAHDHFLLWTSATRLCRDADARWALPATNVPWLLGVNNSIYLGVLSGLPAALHEPLHQALTAHPWYIGMMAVDPADALHRQIFDLIPGWQYNEGWIADSPEQFDPHKTFAGLPVAGFGCGPRPLPSCDILPAWRTALEVVDTNPRTYQEALTTLLAHYAEAERSLAFQVGRRHPVVDDLYGKLHDYALNPAHPVGGAKAQFFIKVLGIGRDDWRLLAIQLISALTTAEPKKFRDHPQFGQQHLRFEVTARVLGLNGRAASVTTAWRIEDDGPVELVTVTPAHKRKASEQDTPLDVEGWASEWASLYEIAADVAEQARRACRPHPLVLSGGEGVEVIAEGPTGFAWVVFPDPAAPFVAWLLAQGHGRKDSDGEVWVSAPTFDYKPAQAWAEAFAAVVQAAGHDCTVTALID